MNKTSQKETNWFTETHRAVENPKLAVEMEELKSGTLLHLPFPCIADVSTAWEILYETKIIAKHDVNSFETGSLNFHNSWFSGHSFLHFWGWTPHKKCDKLSPFMKLLMTKRALPCQISWDQVLKPESSGGLQVLLPGRLTWNLRITHLEKENDLPNLHDYVPAVNLHGCTR